MKIFSITIAVITGLLLFSTMVCGLWIKANNVTDAGSLNFHIYTGIASFIFSSVAVILLILISLRQYS